MSSDSKRPPGAIVGTTPASLTEPTSTSATAQASAKAESDTDAASSASPDVVVLGPPTADGAGVHVLRARPQGLETGELRSLQEGKPITGEIVTLAPRKDNPRVCDVKESYAPPKHLRSSSEQASSPGKKAKGPAQVATQAYRDNWDEVFARRPPGGVLN